MICPGCKSSFTLHMSHRDLDPDEASHFHFSEDVSGFSRHGNHGTSASMPSAVTAIVACRGCDFTSEDPRLFALFEDDDGPPTGPSRHLSSTSRSSTPAAPSSPKRIKKTRHACAQDREAMEAIANVSMSCGVNEGHASRAEEYFSRICQATHTTKRTRGYAVLASMFLSFMDQNRTSTVPYDIKERIGRAVDQHFFPDQAPAASDNKHCKAFCLREHGNKHVNKLIGIVRASHAPLPSVVVSRITYLRDVLAMMASSAMDPFWECAEEVCSENRKDMQRDVRAAVDRMDSSPHIPTGCKASVCACLVTEVIGESRKLGDDRRKKLRSAMAGVAQHVGASPRLVCKRFDDIREVVQKLSSTIV